MYLDKNENELKGSCKVQYEKFLETKKMLEGKTFYTKYGTPYVLVEYNGCSNRSKILFPFSGIEKEIFIKDIKDVTEGQLSKLDPFYNNGGFKHYPFVFENPMDGYRDIIYTNGDGDKYKVLEYNSPSDMTIQFLNPPYYIKKHVNERYVKDGSVRDPYHKNSYGGFIGENKEYSNSEYTWLLQIWSGMLLRSNNHEKFHEYTSNNGSMNTAYDDCTVCEEWLEYSVFARDYLNKLSKLNPNYTYDLDKDLLYPFYKDRTNGLKLYSDLTTVLIPKDINRHFLALKPDKSFNSTSDNYVSRNIYNYRKFIENLENWGVKLKFYFDENCLSLETYNLLESIRLEKLRIAKELNPDLEQRRIEKYT